jgi:LemA protein
VKRTLWIVLGIVVLLVIYVVSTYNGFVSGKTRVESSWAQVEAQMQRRIDLIPNLVATVKGAAEFEQETFTAVTEARSRWQGATTRSEKVALAGEFDSALSRLLLTFENYPQLQATQAFRDLMTQLEGTENRISVARLDYNEAVRAFNIRIRRFPARLLAGAFGFTEEEFYASVEGADKAVEVEF